MDKEDLYRKIKDQEKRLSKTNEEITRDYFEGKEVDYQPYALSGPDFAIANYFGYQVKDLMDSPDCQRKVAEEKERLGAFGNSLVLEGKESSSLIGSGLARPANDIARNSSQVLKDYKDFPKIKDFDFLSSPLYKKKIERGRALVENNPKTPMSLAVNGPITTAATVRPIAMIMRDMRKDRENLHMLMDWITEATIDWIRLYYREVGVGRLKFMDPVATNNLLTADQFREFAFPYLERMVDEANRLTDQGVHGHICGRTKAIWEDLGRLELRSFSVDNIEDIGELKKALGEKMIIRGNVAPVDVLRYGTIDDVIESVIEILKKAGDSPKGFILEPGCMITPASPRENLWAMVYAVREYGSGARLGQLPKGLAKLS